MSITAKYFILAFPITSAGLGLWQLKRLEWKKDLIKEIESRTKGELIDLFSIKSSQDLEQYEYHLTKVIGHYDQNPDNQIFIKPKTLVLNREARLKGRSEKMINTGVHVITPFEIENSNLRILVNRGWLPLRGYHEMAKNGLGEEGEPPIEVTGIIRKSEIPSAFSGKTAHSSIPNERNYRDIKDLAKTLNTAPIYIEAVENTKIGTIPTPVAGQTRLTIRNEHLNYAITWFGLAFFTYILWHKKYMKKFISIK